jgi:alginate O-acetyltransferase complex protein AlgI
MNPKTLAHRGRPRPARSLLREAGWCAALGVLGLAAASRAPLPPWAGFTACAIGCSLVVHFGAFALMTAGLRALGFPAERLFVSPWRARTLAEFWGRRWNRGFAELTALAVHRPLRRFGEGRATAAAFLFSGVLHELAITVPARDGYGMPTLYFAIQAAAVRAERKGGGRTWTWACLLLGLPLVFPAEFRVQVWLWCRGWWA